MKIKQTAVERRNYGVAVLVGIIGGIVSAIIKFGWEVPLPPRTPERNATNPPQAFLEQLGFSDTTTHLSYTFNGNEGLPWISFLIHFGFAIFFAVLYCILAERFPQIKLWQGVAFGIFIWVAFHVVLMPLMGTVPAPWDQPWQEHFSEIPGHAIWLWVIEIFRRDLRNRITGEPDPEVELSTARA
ncbi:YagU family protein [Arcanobacterium ihumii]|uniref:YagU family protein n=1 Tax=Arcanobacterium ihumii TaxID=2138162 RepID=UPI000F5396D2|nr:YagU family protein [Arcanobacterium ihumii]